MAWFRTGDMLSSEPVVTKTFDGLLRQKAAMFWSDNSVKVLIVLQQETPWILKSK